MKTSSGALEQKLRSKAVSTVKRSISRPLLLPSSTLSLSLPGLQGMKELRSLLSASPDPGDGSPTGDRQLPGRSRFFRSTTDCPRSPSRPSSSAVPFSWEQRPGIPKIPANPKSRPTDPLLPLPPPLRSSSSSSSSESFHKNRSDARAAADPFVAALAECAKEPRPPSDGEAEMGMEKLRRRSQKGADRRRGAVWSISDRFGIFGLVGSCKSGRCSVADSTVCVPRSSLRNGNAYGLLNRRAA